MVVGPLLAVGILAAACLPLNSWAQTQQPAIDGAAIAAAEARANKQADEAAAKAEKEEQNTAVASQIPFVGCESDGQSGPVSAPHGPSKAVHIDAKVN